MHVKEGRLIYLAKGGIVVAQGKIRQDHEEKKNRSLEVMRGLVVGALNNSLKQAQNKNAVLRNTKRITLGIVANPAQFWELSPIPHNSGEKFVV